MATKETETSFWQNVVIILSTFVISLSSGLLVGIRQLEAAQAQEVKVVAKIDVPSVQAVAQVQAKPVELLEIEAAAIVEAGEGIEHAFVRQLVKSGSDLKSAQKKAHQITILSGFVSSDREIRVKDGQQEIAYVLNLDQGQIITYLNGDEVQRTQIADNYQQIKQLTPAPFEYLYIS